MEVELQVSSNIISGLDVLLIDILLVSFCHLVTHALFRRLKLKKVFAEGIPDQLVKTSACNISVELLGHRPAANLLVLNSIFVAVLALITGFGITGKTGVKLEQPFVLLHADLSPRPLNVSDLDAFVIEGRTPDRKTRWGGVFNQQNECLQKNMTHDQIIRMAVNDTSADSSEEDGIWPPKSTGRVCLDPAFYVDADRGKRVVAESVLFVKRSYEIDSIGDCHLHYEGPGQERVSQEGRGRLITDMFTQPIVLRNCVPEEVKLESTCARGSITACVTKFTTPWNSELVLLATWDVDVSPTEAEPYWRNMMLNDVFRSDGRPALTLSKWQQWNVAQMIAGRYVVPLNEAVLASNSALTETRVQGQQERVASTTLSVGLFFTPLGLILVDISVLILALVMVTMELRRRGVTEKVNVASDTKELLNLVKETLSPLGKDGAKLLVAPLRRPAADYTSFKTGLLVE